MEKTIHIEATMEERWLPYFLGMLDTMQGLGGIGASRMIQFYSDGDGDFRPTFDFKAGHITLAHGNERGNTIFFDAG